MRHRPFYVSVRKLAANGADNSCPYLPLQELMEVALFPTDVRNLASEKTSKGENL
jgi:hypothetical protein